MTVILNINKIYVELEQPRFQYLGMNSTGQLECHLLKHEGHTIMCVCE